MLKKLNISASGYYGHFKSEPSKSKQRKTRLTKEIKDIYEKSYRIYGSPKITAILKKNGETVSQKYVYTIMKENSLKARYIKPYCRIALYLIIFPQSLVIINEKGMTRNMILFKSYSLTCLLCYYL